MPGEAIIAFGIALLISLGVTPLLTRYAARLNIFDNPNEMKRHPVPVPAVGGIAIYLSIAITSLIAILLNERISISFIQNSRFWAAIAAAATMIFFVGLFDDIKHASIWVRFSVQGIAALITIYVGGVSIANIGIPLDGLKSTGWLAVPLTVIWIVGVTNAFNLIDGLDGLAGGIGFISTATVFVIAVLTTSNYMVILVSAALCGAILGFLRYNKPPAKVFLGDCGSMLLGYSLSVLAILGRTKKTTMLAVLIPVLIVGVPVLDTLTSMARRLARKVKSEHRFKLSYLLSMFAGDRGHIHHLLLEHGHTQGLSVVVLYALSIMMAGFALIATIANQEIFGVILGLVGVGAFFAVRQGWPRFLWKNGRNGKSTAL